MAHLHTLKTDKFAGETIKLLKFMSAKKLSLLFILSMFSCLAMGQKWIKICEDEGVTIYYDSKTQTDKKGNHIVWVKAVYHTIDWQTYFANQIGIKTPVTVTKTKAMYDPIYSYVLVRQVICYSKAGKVLFDSGDDFSGGWGMVNASDPVGLVGEYLCEKQAKRE